ncbi:MAG TPA: hypothetical protein VFW19_09705 [Allosphingosinicella sp.]|nr:hypothetical protein [Allosphingosinicella sp.]
MSHESDRNHLYHVERARAELDAAYRAEQAEVAAAHLRLCSLHMHRARETCPRPAKELEWLEGLAPLHERALRCA